MTTPMSERPRCGMPCLRHPHDCDRSPGHSDWHRDVQQKGDHTCAWSTPSPKDVSTILAALRSARAEVERLRAELAFAKDHAAQWQTVNEQAEAERDRLAASLSTVSLATAKWRQGDISAYEALTAIEGTVAAPGTEAGR